MQFIQNYSDEKFIPAGQNKVLDRLVDNYSIPKTSTSPSSSTSIVTVSSAADESSTTTATAKLAAEEPFYISWMTVGRKLPVLVMIQVITNQHLC